MGTSGTADVNWLLSTAVQSGAALVAIIGGLLVARLVGLGAERSALLRQRADLNAACNACRKRLDAAIEDLRRWYLSRFMIFSRDKLVALHGSPTEAELADLIARSGWEVDDVANAELLQPELERLRAAFAAVGQWRDGRNPRSLESDEAVAALRGRHRDADVRDAFQRLEREVPRLGHSSVMDNLGLSYLGLGDPATAAADRQTRDRRTDEAEGVVSDARREVVLAGGRLDAIEHALDGARQPEGLRRTMGSLVYLALSCLVLPLALMAWGEVTLPAWTRALIVVVFVSGLGVFFTELVALMRGLRRADS